MRYMTTFDEIVSAAKNLTVDEQARLVDELRSPKKIPAAAWPGIEAGLADLKTGRTASEQDLAAITAKVEKVRSSL